MASAKFPRMSHLPWSPGGTREDRRLRSADHLMGTELVVTEKMDGSNVCMTREALFARSHSRPPRHPSFDLAKATWAVCHASIPEGLSVFAEWCYARHSIQYTGLPTYLLVIAVRDDGSGEWWSWPRTAEMAMRLGTETVPELSRVTVDTEERLVRLTGRIARSRSRFSHEVREGIVVRRLGSFREFSASTAKWVREGRVRTGDHWSRGRIVRNTLRPG